MPKASHTHTHTQADWVRQRNQSDVLYPGEVCCASLHFDSNADWSLYLVLPLSLSRFLSHFLMKQRLAEVHNNKLWHCSVSLSTNWTVSDSAKLIYSGKRGRSFEQGQLTGISRSEVRRIINQKTEHNSKPNLQFSFRRINRVFLCSLHQLRASTWFELFELKQRTSKNIVTLYHCLTTSWYEFPTII